MKKITGFVETVFFAAPSFSAGKLKTESGLVSFAGNVFAEIGQHLTLVGKWAKHPKYGFQFKVANIDSTQMLDPKGLAHFIANHPEIKGVGPVKARLLADEFGSTFGEALESDPERVAKVASLKPETVANLTEVWRRHASTAGTLTWLAQFELTHHQSKTIVDRYGNNAKRVLEKNPYLMIQDVEGMGFRRVDAVAQAMGISKRNQQRVRAGILDCVNTETQLGHTWTARPSLITRANDLLAMDELDSESVIDDELSDLLTGKELSLSEQADETRISPAPLWRQESKLAEIIKHAGPNQHAARDDLDALIDAQGRTLEPEQRAAVLTSITNRLSLVSGGAGSGKTYTIAAIVDLIQHLGEAITLTAPTGKAAKRMEELVGESAQTIHRLLGFDGTGWKHDSMNQLKTDWIIVDEVSMVDIPLAWRLFSAVNWTRTSVILVGDHNQLEPVGPGNVLRDLISSERFPKTILKTCKRQAGLLRENSLAILSGRVPPTPASGDDRDALHDWYVLPKFKDPVACSGYLEHLYQNVLSERFGFDLVGEVQVASPTHKGTLGTREINLVLQRLVQAKLFGRAIPEVLPKARPPLYANDKIIMTQNNYDLDIMNGTLGSVVSDQNGLVVNFEGKVIELKKSSPVLRQLELAYCLTIHKLQGSETPCVIVICHRDHAFQLNRNLLYTGVTRASRTAFILGDPYGIKVAAETQTTQNRRTNLSALIG